MTPYSPPFLPVSLPMTLRTLTILLIFVVPTPAAARTSGELYNRCIYRYPGAAAACNRSINEIYQELKSSGMKCEAADKAEAKDFTNAVLDYLRTHPEVHNEPAIAIIKDAVRLVFRCA